MTKITIDTDPCDTCDYCQCACGRDMEDCAKWESNKKTEPILIVGCRMYEKNLED